jgi:hypothetical protein
MIYTKGCYLNILNAVIGDDLAAGPVDWGPGTLGPMVSVKSRSYMG